MYHTYCEIGNNQNLVYYLLIAFLGGIVGYATHWILSFRQRNSDEADERRKNGKRFVPPDDIEYSASWQPNSRGMLLYTQEFSPILKGRQKCLGTIGMCHGFGDHTNDLMADLAVKFCRAGFAVITLDAEGHGLSDGVHGAIFDLKTVSNDL
jgi:hypothetical protein